MSVQPSNSSESRLRAARVSVKFGGLLAVNNVDLELHPDVILGLIGPNGAGKTTLVNVLSGFERRVEGKVILDEEDITKFSPPQRASIGIVRTFQGARLFPTLSVIENAMIGGLALGHRHAEALELAWSALDRFGLGADANLPAGNLPYGKERLLDLARAVASQPRYLLMDEPAAGLTDVETEQMAEAIHGMRRDFGLGILLIEHDMSLVMAVCEEIQGSREGSNVDERPQGCCPARSGSY